MKNLNKYPQVREVPFTKKDLIDFEEKIVSLWEDGQIRAPVHLSNGNEDEFENIWRERESFLDNVDGFLEFNLLKGPSDGETTIYASHTKWKSKTDFEMWTKSESFREAHKNAGKNKKFYAGHPEFEGFNSIF